VFYFALLTVDSVTSRQVKYEYGALVHRYWRGKTELLGEKGVIVQLPPPQFAHRLSWDRKWVCLVRGWLPTAWAKARSVRIYWTNCMNVLITYVGQYQKKVTLLTVGWTVDTDFDIFTAAFWLRHSLRSRGRLKR